MTSLHKRYGLWTATAMVVGVVIGSGVFFKADDVLKLTEGNVLYALLAWGIGAFAMIFGALVFAQFAQRIEKSNGIVDYAETAYGDRFGYLVGWFKGVLYYAPLSAILAWVAALYTLILAGSDSPDNSPLTWALAVVYLVVAYLVNYYSPILAGKIQVSTTIIKLIPLTLIAVVGTIYGMFNNVLFDSFSAAAGKIGSTGGSLSAAVVSTAFAYEGWIVATTINSEIKDSKKVLPKALTIGSLAVLVVYIAYFLGIAGVLPAEEIIAQGNAAVSVAASTLFGSFAASLLTAFVVVSCLGTLNGLIISLIRTHYSLAVRNNGPAPNLLSRLSEKTNMPAYTAVYASILSAVYLSLWYGSFNGWYGEGRFVSIDEIPIVLIYGMYLFLYVYYIKEFKDLNAWKRFGVPILATVGSLIILYGGFRNPSIGLYLIISVVVLLLGLVFYRKPEKTLS